MLRILPKKGVWFISYAIVISTTKAVKGAQSLAPIFVQHESSLPVLRVTFFSSTITPPGIAYVATFLTPNILRASFVQVLEPEAVVVVASINVPVLTT